LRGADSIYAAVAAQLDLPLATFDEDQSNRVVFPFKLEYLGKQA
jgi:predicted nucleic acid-binding protein